MTVRPIMARTSQVGHPITNKGIATREHRAECEAKFQDQSQPDAFYYAWSRGSPDFKAKERYGHTRLLMPEGGSVLVA